MDSRYLGNSLRLAPSYGLVAVCKHSGKILINKRTQSAPTCINFCVDSVVPIKTNRKYSNNKPWITREIKEAINKKLAFKSKNKEHDISTERTENHTGVLKKRKDEYKNKIEKYSKT